jgi:hypothetical protein
MIAFNREDYETLDDDAIRQALQGVAPDGP